jgi:single-stranded DNA-binding protein
MSDTNFISGVVKILETPKQQIINNNILVTSFRVQFPQVRNNSIVHLKFWGNLARDVGTYYKINDYILIEGYIALKDKQTGNSNIQMSKKIEIIVLKIYPFLLSYDRSKIAALDC